MTLVQANISELGCKKALTVKVDKLDFIKIEKFKIQNQEN